VCLAVICEALKRLKLRRVKPDAILVMDNLRPHRATQGRDLLDQAGIGLMYLPRYSPEFNPIEQAWAKVKERLKAKAARSLEALEAELRPALDTITAKDAKGWFRHAGYALHRPRNRFNLALQHSTVLSRSRFLRSSTCPSLNDPTVCL
jgi:transposase